MTPRCPVRTALELVGGKWRLLILQQLQKGPVRYTALRRTLPDISDKMLAQELRALADSDLLCRSTDDDGAVHYTLTDAGAYTAPLIESLAQFGLHYTSVLFGSPEKEKSSSDCQGPSR